MTDRIPVVYIMGSGRSGSTVLDTVLGAHPNAESFGELSNLVRAAWFDSEYCACGTLGSACEFWRAVRERWSSGEGEEARYLELQERFERVRSLPRLLAEARCRSSAYREWATRTAALYRAIQTESGAPVLVDSSKNPIRGYALGTIEELDIFYVHLVRDGRGVAWSLSKSFKRDDKAGVQKDLKPKSVTRTALFWSVVNALATWIRGRAPQGRSALIRYEDYSADLGAALEPLSGFIGEMESLAKRVMAGEELATGHTIAGNRLRMGGAVRLRPDVEWLEGMPIDERRRFWRVAGLQMRRFGYPR